MDATVTAVAFWVSTLQLLYNYSTIVPNPGDFLFYSVVYYWTCMNVINVEVTR